jgi:hypothetical protein
MSTKSIFERYKIKSEFPRLTQVCLVKDNLGYYLKRVHADEVLDMTFKDEREAKLHASAEYWVVVLNDFCEEF